MARTKTTTYGGGNKRRRLNPLGSQGLECSNAAKIRRDRGNSGGSSSFSSSRSGASPPSLPSPCRSGTSPPSPPSSSRGGSSRHTTDEDMRRTAYKAIMKELDLVNDASSRDFTAAPVGDDPHLWEAHVNGPADSPYAGAAFFLSIRLPPDYPMSPPKVIFKVKDFFHSNISETGSIGLQILENQMWTRLFSIDKAIVELLRRLGMEPEYIMLQPELAKIYKEDIRLYQTSAQSWIEEYIQSMK